MVSKLSRGWRSFHGSTPWYISLQEVRGVRRQFSIVDILARFEVDIIEGERVEAPLLLKHIQSHNEHVPRESHLRFS